MSIRRAVIIGAGAVGAGTAAQLALHGIDHLLIGRGQQIRHIAEHGLRYRRPDGEHLVRLNTAEGIGAAELDAGDLAGSIDRRNVWTLQSIARRRRALAGTARPAPSVGAG
ncbi:2-dehydropantoate 2-reductase N-terminal domain-containing protein [Nesterenkonia sp.]|uniref:2-dehydropantoate 2-reductase N-terminal domain-containing protein n=1 Tax=Nesterenkonia sp. TaxID=704201 RepID=UPI00263420D4|nr:2-dehydropantoate 2-reductase N-terminal domain-containing protein [Nesterenkonia sp.]